MPSYHDLTFGAQWYTGHRTYISAQKMIPQTLFLSITCGDLSTLDQKPPKSQKSVKSFCWLCITLLQKWGHPPCYNPSCWLQKNGYNICTIINFQCKATSVYAKILLKQVFKNETKKFPSK